MNFDSAVAEPGNLLLLGIGLIFVTFVIRKVVENGVRRSPKNS
jgi:hypothetical protein